jgi:hypothetical protein
MRSNPSIERTSKRLRLFAAAHVERYASALEPLCFVPGPVHPPVRVVSVAPSVAVPRMSRRAWLLPFFASGASRVAGRASSVGAAPAVEGQRRAGAERPAVCSTAVVPVNTSGRTPRQRLFGPGSHNPSIERTVSGKLRLPPTAAHVERWTSQGEWFAL